MKRCIPKAALGLLAVSFLVGCADSKKMWRQSEIEAIAADAADDAASDVAGGYGIEEFERRIMALEQENRQLQDEVSSLRSDLETLESQHRAHTHY